MAKPVNARRQIEWLRALEELDTNLKDIENPGYRKLYSNLQIVDFVKSAEKRRKELCAQIDEKRLAEYERIKKRYGSKVVVQVVTEFCGGCYVKLPSELATRGKQEVLSCPNCGRFLYVVQ